MKFSIVMPTWNEGVQIGSALKRLREISDESSMEIILVDGGSTDKTVEHAKEWVDQLKVLASPNRGAQLHAGAGLAKGDLLFFLHADTQPPCNWQERLEKVWLGDPHESLAATVFSVDYGNHLPYRLVAAGQNWRARCLGLAYGDQGFCVSSEIYAKTRGFPEQPLMEDIEFCNRLRRFGRIRLLPELIRPSARRLHRSGALLNSLYNQWIFLRYVLGADPQKLWRKYYKKALKELPPQGAVAEDPSQHPFAYLRDRKSKSNKR